MDQNKIKEDLSKEDQMKIYKILLLTYSKRLSIYQNQIKYIYLNNIISNIKDEVNDYLLNEHVTSQHYFIDTLIRSNENQNFLKSIQLLENKVNKKENIINEANGDSNNQTQANYDVLNNEQSENNRRNQRAIFNNYITEIIERSHIFILVKIFFVLFLFEANLKVYFIISGMFILYNRGFFDFLINNFNFMYNNETVEQVLRRMSESRNLNNSGLNYNNQENNNPNEVIEENNERTNEENNEKKNEESNEKTNNKENNEKTNNEENNTNHLNSLLNNIEKENEKTIDEKLNTENELLSLLNMGNNNEFNDGEYVNKFFNVNEINENIDEINKNNIPNMKNIEMKLKRKNINLYESNIDNEYNEKYYNNFNENLEKNDENSFYSFKKAEKTYDGRESNIIRNSYDAHDSSQKPLNLNEDNDYEIQENRTDSYIYNKDINEKEEKKNFHNFVIEETPDIFNSINDSYIDTNKILESGIRRRKKKNKISLNDSINSISNVLNNNMSEFITSDFENSPNNSDTDGSNFSNIPSIKTKQSIQNTQIEQPSKREIIRRKPTKLEKYIYQSVVMFFMTLLPWWTPDVAYLEE